MAIYGTMLSQAVVVDSYSSIPNAYALRLADKAMLGETSLRIRDTLLKKGEGDSGFIAGKVTEQGLPVSRRVMCYHRYSGVLIAITWSDVNGDYRFDNLVAGVKYYVVALDENNDSAQYNAVTQDLITASEVIT